MRGLVPLKKLETVRADSLVDTSSSVSGALVLPRLALSYAHLRRFAEMSTKSWPLLS